SAPAAPVAPGATVPYTLTITNSGQTPYTGIQVTDDMTGALDDAAHQPAVIVSGGGALTFTTPLLVWTGDVAIGAAVTIRYDMLVNKPDTGDKNMVNTV